MGKDFIYLGHVNVEEWYESYTHFYVSYEKISI